MTKLLAVNGSYRESGAIDQAVDMAVSIASNAGVTTEVVRLRDYPIEFCRNCRHCTQEPGDAPGACIHHDGMCDLVSRIEAADMLILASPTNFSSVTAVFKRFLERLIVYAYWPWGSHAPRFRKKRRTKMALLIASSAAPAFLAKYTFDTLKQLRMTAKILGAKPVGSVFIGLMSKDEHPDLPEGAKKKLHYLVNKMLQ